MKNLVSLTGPRAAGKTTLAGMLIEQLSYAHMVESITTRSRRPSDLPGEYSYLESVDLFHEMDRGRLFEWTAEYGGTHYGTMPGSIREIFEFRDTLGIMILLPEVVPKLWQFLEKIGKDHRYVPTFVLPPERDVLEQRLLERGDAPESIRESLDRDINFLRKAQLSGIPYKYIQNNGSIETALAELKSVIGI